MIVALFLIWGMLYVIHTVYSYRFMYQRPSGRPLGYHEQKTVFSIIEMVALFALCTLLVVRGEIIYALLAIIITILTRIAIRKITYNRAIREVAALYKRVNKMSREKAIAVAKITIEREIRDGRLSV